MIAFAVSGLNGRQLKVNIMIINVGHALGQNDAYESRRYFGKYRCAGIFIRQYTCFCYHFANGIAN